VQAFASLILCSAVAGVLSPLLSSSMLALALGASALSVSGALSWWWYCQRQRVPPRLAPADASVTLQAEIAEPL
jgi:DHA1 family bicyclomycin/chloramphenicol resistance-like MFS transporter